MCKTLKVKIAYEMKQKLQPNTVYLNHFCLSSYSKSAQHEIVQSSHLDFKLKKDELSHMMGTKGHR